MQSKATLLLQSIDNSHDYFSMWETIEFTFELYEANIEVSIDLFH